MAKVADRYRGDGAKRYHQKHDVPQAAHKWIALSRAQKFSAFIDSDHVVLEYGVGPGWNLSAISCKQRLGYDLSDLYEAQLATNQIRFVADTQSLPDGSIDAIICHHVLEHVSDPVRVLLEIRRLLREKGKLMLVVPYERERKYRHFNNDDPNHHLYSWNVQTLGNLVHDVGFRIHLSAIGRYGYDRFISVWAMRLGIGAAGFKLLKKCALATIPLLEVRVVAVKSDFSRNIDLTPNGAV